MMLPYLYGCLPMMLCKSGKQNLYVKIVFCCITIGCNTNIAYISTHICYITMQVIQKKNLFRDAVEFNMQMHRFYKTLNFI